MRTNCLGQLLLKNTRNTPIRLFQPVIELIHKYINNKYMNKYVLTQITTYIHKCYIYI